MEWVRYLAFKLYLSFWAYWQPPLPPDEADEEDIPAINFYSMPVPETPWPSPVHSQDLSGFESEDEWEHVE